MSIVDVDIRQVSDNALLFASHFAQAIRDSLGHSYVVNRQNFSEEPFAHANGLVVTVRFGGSVQGDYMIEMAEETAAALLDETDIPLDQYERNGFRIEAVDMLTRLVNTAVGQAVQRLEENHGIISFDPAAAFFGEMFFPKVLSRRFTISGDCGPITCILSLNMGGLRIARRLDEMQGFLEDRTQQAYRDKLTQLHNRAFYDEVFVKYIHEADRYDSELSLIVIDVDFFKRFNDEYGHVVGDTVLASVAGVLRSVLRKSDVPVRYGGDEMLVILPETNCVSAKRAAERIAEGLAANPVFIAKGGERIMLEVTLSIGVGQFEHGENGDSFFKRVDAMLYCAKETGRDRIVATCDEPSKSSGFAE